MTILQVKKLTKVYNAFKAAKEVVALNEVNLNVDKGEFVGIMGPSGSGKTTLLNILSGIDKATSGEVHIAGKDIMKYLGIEEIQNKYPYNISGGQKQRTAAARALICEPSVIFGDEPTGNLDSKSSKSIMKTFKNMNEERNATVIMVTHDAFAASFCKRIIFIKDGEINLEITSDGDRKKFFDKILEAQSVIGGKE